VAANPLMGMLARQVVGKLAGGGGQGAPPMGAMQNAQPPDQAGMQVQQQLAELKGADPDSTLKMLQQMKSQVVAMYSRTAFSIPGVSRNLAQMQKYLDNAIKECEQATATASAAGGPIANNAGINNPLQQSQQGNSPLPGLQSFAGA
jgi:hypothetical protein